MATRKDQSTDLTGYRPAERAVFDDGDDDFAPSERRTADDSRQRRSSHRTAASMLSFYLDRAGSSLPEDRRRMLEKAKNELLRG